MNKTTEALKLAEEAMTSNMRLLSAKALAAIRAAREQELNLNCKSVQKRLATQWGYVKSEQAEQEPVATDLVDMLRLIETIKYLRGIAERGLGREIRDDETIEQFVLGYVKQLEAAPVRTKDLTDEEIEAVCVDIPFTVKSTKYDLAVARAVIAADREKNK